MNNFVFIKCLHLLTNLTSCFWNGLDERATPCEEILVQKNRSKLFANALFNKSGGGKSKNLSIRAGKYTFWLFALYAIALRLFLPRTLKT